MKFKGVKTTVAAAGIYMVLNVLFRIPSVIDGCNPFTLKKVKHYDSQVEIGYYNQLLPWIGKEFVFEKNRNGEYLLRMASNNEFYAICDENGKITSAGSEMESGLLIEEGKNIGKKEGLLKVLKNCE